MAKFLTRLNVSPVVNRLWITNDWFIVETREAGLVEIPPNFMFDGNSLPRFLWWLSVPTDFLEAGATHDYLYRYGDDQKVADRAYKEVLHLQGMGKVRRWARYVALRLFGWMAFRKAQRGLS
jgi:hypothetical protein